MSPSLVERVYSHRLKFLSLFVGISLVAIGDLTSELALIIVGIFPLCLGIGQLASYWGTHY